MLTVPAPGYILKFRPDKRLRRMEGSVRLFAAEFCAATLTVPGEDERSSPWIVTPYGARFREVFLAGALIELHEDGDPLTARLADPTGGFDLVCGGKAAPAAAALRSLSCPTFISVLGRAGLYSRGGEVSRSIRPEHVRAIDRPVRDQWVLATAHDTLDRLLAVQQVLAGRDTGGPLADVVRHYGVTAESLDEFAGLMERVVEGIQPKESVAAGEADVRARVVDILKAQPGPRGVPVQEIIDTLGSQGMFQDVVLKAIEGLIVDDECYQPQKGYIRLL